MAGTGNGGIEIGIVGGDSRGRSEDLSELIQQKNKKVERVSQDLERGSPPTSSGNQTGGRGFGNAGDDPLLAEIRSRIEHAKNYPLLAKKMSLEGKALIQFQIDEAGNPQNIILKNSSSSKILDDEALATIQRAAPYPLYKDPLEVWILFTLTP